MNNYHLTINEVIRIININTGINKRIANKENLDPKDLHDLDKQTLINIILNNESTLATIKRELIEVTIEELGTQDIEDELEDHLEDVDIHTLNNIAKAIAKHDFSKKEKENK